MAKKSFKDFIFKFLKDDSKQKPYVSMAGGQYSVLDSDGKEVYKTRDKTLAFAYLKKNFDKSIQAVKDLFDAAKKIDSSL